MSQNRSSIALRMNGNEMPQIIECVPNFSEGRDKAVIDQLVFAVKSVPEVQLLHQTSDADHNRTVLTFAGEPYAVVEAAFRTVKIASEMIDLQSHEGEHPFIGAADVVPVVPVNNISMEECVHYAHVLGERIGSDLNLPVFMYEYAATRDENRNLAEIRRGGYSGLKQRLTADPPFVPDYGPCELGKAGAVVVGARDILIAFNVFLKTSDVEVAKVIASRIRERDGGLPFVKALGFLVDGRAQVSMNLTNYRVTPPHVAVQAVKELAEEQGVEVAESELIGLLPEEAVMMAARHALGLPSLDDNRILDRLIRKTD